MNIEEILDSEKRNEDNLYDIHFYMEGSFWRAYEWSAYLSRHFPSELTEDERLKPTKKITKTCKDWYVHIGLPLSSFEKYLPGVVNDDNIFESSYTYNTRHRCRLLRLNYITLKQ
jgi:hypothetical protein